MAIEPLVLSKNVYSTYLPTFSIVIALGLIFTGQSWLSSAIHTAFVCDCMISATVWLSLAEGGKGPLNGLVPVNIDQYKDAHPIASLYTATPQKSDNLRRYLLGRQVVVVLIVVIVNLTGASPPVSKLWGFPAIILTGFAMILFTCMVGPLNLKINAPHCKLDSLNAYIELFTLYVATVVEFSGLLDSSHLIQMLGADVSGNKTKSNEGQTKRSALFLARCLMSLAILGSCVAVTLAALFTGNTNMWEGVPEVIPVVFFFFLVSAMALLEGLHIAFFAVRKLREGERSEAKLARMIYDLLSEAGLGSPTARRKGRGKDGQTGMRPRMMSTAMSGKRQLRR